VATYFEATNIRQLQIEKHYGRVMLLNHSQRLRAACRLDDLEAGLSQIARFDVALRFLIVHIEDCDVSGH
jgi:hypothetical protein